MLSGTTSSTGMAYGKIFILEKEKSSFDGAKEVDGFDPHREVETFKRAVSASKNELARLREEVRLKIGEKEEKIFEAQELILEDPAFIEEVEKRILKDNLSAKEAVKYTIVSLEQQFLNIEDKIIRQRIADIKDVGSRILRILNKEVIDALGVISEPVVLITEYLYPSQAARLDREKVLAIVTERGGINCHASIIARSLDIPAVVGVKGAVEEAKKHTYVMVDGYSGSIVFDPPEQEVNNFLKLKAKREEKRERSFLLKEKLKTRSGDDVYLFANIGRLSELNKLKEYRVEGVGVLRTEFMLLNRHSPPSEDDFTSGFKTILEFMAPLPVNIRLLDVGTDKTFPFLSHPKESNPALGRRGVRFLLANPHILKAQLRGILRASVSGNARILLPMVTTLEEVREIIKILRRTEMEMAREETRIKTHIPVGVMIETPASALLVKHMAKEVDFFSIGTNDLTQYVLAADRSNEYVQDIYNGLHPAVLKIIDMVVKGAKKYSVEVTVCGEMASDIKAIPLLLGLGVYNLSVGVNMIPNVIDVVRQIDISKAKRLAKRAVKAKGALEVEKMVLKFLESTRK